MLSADWLKIVDARKQTKASKIFFSIQGQITLVVLVRLDP